MHLKPSGQNRRPRLAIYWPAYAMLAIIALGFAIGALADNSPANILASIFAAYLLYSFFAACLIAIPLLFKNDLPPFVFKEQSIVEGGQVSIVLPHGPKGFLRAISFFPGILLRLRLDFQAKSGRSFSLCILPHQKESQNSEPLLRGLYTTNQKCFFISDVLSSFGFFVPLRPKEDLNIQVSSGPWPKTIHLPPLLGGQSQYQIKAQQHSDNLGVHRKYLPGDDPRRINWKLFGHSDELILREFDREPPPRSELLVIIDSYVQPKLYPQPANALDGLCRYASSLAASAEQAGKELRFIGPDGLICGEGQEQRINYLAGLAPSSTPFNKLPPLAAQSCLFICLPHSQGIPALKELPKTTAVRILCPFFWGKGHNLSLKNIFFTSAQNVKSRQISRQQLLPLAQNQRAQARAAGVQSAEILQY